MSTFFTVIALVVLGCGGTASGGESPAEPRSDDGTYLGRTIARTMGVGGAPWLVREGRVAEEDPRDLHEQLGLEPGDTVCDVGAGNGYHTLPLAKRVGLEGKVVATDIQAGMLERLRARATDAGIDNVVTVLSTQEDAKLPAGTCDLVLLVDVYHELSDPEAMLAGIRASLTETGRVALVEYRTEDDTVPMKPLHKMSVAQCDREYSANGFERVGRYDGLPWQHLLFYRPENVSTAERTVGSSLACEGGPVNR